MKAADLNCNNQEFVLKIEQGNMNGTGITRVCK